MIENGRDAFAPGALIDPLRGDRHRHVDHERIPLPPGNMRANGVRSPTVSCLLPHHRAVLAVDTWSDHVPVPSFGPRMVRTG
jgi:hypothetical protein